MPQRLWANDTSLHHLTSTAIGDEHFLARPTLFFAV